jgi:hypothetical protein
VYVDEAGNHQPSIQLARKTEKIKYQPIHNHDLRLLVSISYILLLFSPAYTTMPGIVAMVIFISEIAFPLWLLIKDVNKAGWEKRNLGMPLISINRNQTNKELSKMNVFIAGSTGATGKKLTSELLERGHRVVTVVRTKNSLPEELRKHPNMSVTEASLLDLTDTRLQELVKGCDAIVSTLGHNISFKGMYGHPRRLVTDAARRLCEAAKANKPKNSVKFVLMNTTGNKNRDLDEKQSFGEKVVVGLLRVLLPPQADNEAAAGYLRTKIGQNDSMIKWVAVRPDGLIDKDTVTEYTIHPSPLRSPIFDAGQTSRINVGHFMAELIDNDALWEAWKGQMPVIYNKGE